MSALSAQNLSRELTKSFFYFGYSVVHRTFPLSSFKLAEYKGYPQGWSVYYGKPFMLFRHAFAENTARISTFREVERVRKKFPQCSPIDPNYCSHLDLLTQSPQVALTFFRSYLPHYVNYNALFTLLYFFITGVKHLP